MGTLTEARASELLERGSERTVLVVGDLMLDRYVIGTVDRISPEAPVPVVRVDSESSAVGGAGNVAANIAALGASCGAVGCVGRDPAGEEIRAALEAAGVATEGVVASDERATTVKTRILARRQQVVRVDREVEHDVSDAVAGVLVDAITNSAVEADVLVLEDYNKGVLVPRVIEAAMAHSAQRGIPVVVDPKRRNFFAYSGATVVKPNAKELADALGDFLHPEDPVWMEDTRRSLGCQNLLLTLGERGMALQTHSGSHVMVPTVARSVYDVSGAGDTVTAVVAVALAAGGTPEEAAVLANHAAAVEVGKAGVATVSPQEILSHVRATATA